MFNEPRSAFSETGILQFGPDYQGAHDDYIYGYSPSKFPNGLGMFRVGKSKLEHRANYEFFSGHDDSGNSAWSSETASEKPVFEDPADTEWGTTATYAPYLKRYLPAVRHNGEEGDWGLFDAPWPWGS